nr:carbon-nitrogen family hydrolase [Motilibacter aurantiacus]
MIQLDGSLDAPLAERVERVAGLVRAQRGADLVVLPELWAHGAWATGSWAGAAEPLEGAVLAALRQAAADTGCVLHGGSMLERAPDGSVYNTSVVLGPDGALLAAYRKIHRFGFDGGEAAVLAAGDQVVGVDALGCRLGLATCYDLRFPELFRLLVDDGAQAFVVAASWPARRREHWQLLARARAVEDQAYVLACGQSGVQDGVELAGHSAVIDPWGRVVAEAGPDEQVLTVDVDLGDVARVRAEFPVLRDRRLTPGSRV